MLMISMVTHYSRIFLSFKDPTCQNWISLLDDPNIEDKLPREDYCEASRLATIRSLGLKTQMDRNLFVQAITGLQTKSPEVQLEKSYKLWNYFQQQWSTLTDAKSTSLKNFQLALRTIPWLPVMRKPENHALPWFQSKGHLTPAAGSRPKKDEDLVFSAMPIADVKFQDATRQKVLAFFAWDKAPSAQIVLEHLHQIAACDMEASKIYKIVHKIYDVLNNDSEWDEKEFLG